MNYHDILVKILDVYRDCEVQSFPIDCYSILRHYGYRIFTYQNIRDINERLYQYCRNYSEDAFRYGAKRIIAYDENKSPFRIRFSIMHELGHIMLGHSRECIMNSRPIFLQAIFWLPEWPFILHSAGMRMMSPRFSRSAERPGPTHFRITDFGKNPQQKK